jgi:hypothetical protein
MALAAIGAGVAYAIREAAVGRHAEAGHSFPERLAHELALHPVVDAALLLLLAFGDRWLVWLGRLGMLRLIALFFGVELLSGVALVISSVNHRIVKNPDAHPPVSDGPGDGVVVGLPKRLAFLAKMQPVVFFSVLLLAAFPPLMTCVALQDPPDNLLANMGLSVFYLVFVLGALAWIQSGVSQRELDAAQSKRITWAHWTEHAFFTFFGVAAVRAFHKLFGGGAAAAPRRGEGKSGGGGVSGEF